MSMPSPRRPVPARRPARSPALLPATVLAVVASAVLPLVGASEPAVAAGTAARGCAVPLLDEAARAVDVRRDSRSTFAAAAQRNDLSGPGLTELAADRTLWLDECGAAFYVEPVRTGTGEHRAPAPETAPLAAGTDVFDLSSDPGASRTVYLDFLGGTVTGTAWNSYAGRSTIDVAPMSLDAQVSTDLSAAEREAVHQAWTVVAEDYAPFDVNVTTRDPGVDAIRRSSSSDQRYGTRVLVTRGGPIGGTCGCGGIAYVDVIGQTGSAHDYYQPAWVFSDTMSDGWDIGQAASHEVGHTFGLDHDGIGTDDYHFGHGNWAPIMGVSYYSALSQWSRGEYAGASNVEDDLAIIARNAPRRPDDHPGGPAGATPLLPDGSVTGVLGTAQDVDAFAVTAAGDVSVSVGHPQHLDSNLDLRLTVLDSAGRRVATVDPVPLDAWPDAHPVDPGFEAVWSASLPPTPASYTILVEGVGSGDPAGAGYSDYGSLGRYAVSLRGGTSPSEPLSVAGPGSFTVGAGRDFVLTGLSARGGVAPYTWSGDGLPAGARVDPATGTLSGSVGPVADGGVLTGRVAVTDAQGATASHAVSLRVEQLMVPPQSVALVQGLAGAADLQVTGTGPVSWSLRTDVPGALPPGLTLEPDGTLRGTPEAAGTYAVPVRVENAWTSATGEVTVVVDQRALSVSTRSLDDGRVGRRYSERIGLRHAVGPVRWRVVGTLPAGLALRPDADSRSARLTGSPGRHGRYRFTVRVTDRATGLVAARTFRLTVRR